MTKTTITKKVSGVILKAAKIWHGMIVRSSVCTIYISLKNHIS